MDHDYRYLFFFASEGKSNLAACDKATRGDQPCQDFNTNTADGPGRFKREASQLTYSCRAMQTF
jgi:hypothetical protein